MKKLLILLAAALTFSCTQTQKLYVGTSSPKGLFILSIDDSGKLTKIHQNESLNRPEFLAYSPDKKHLYAITDGQILRSFKRNDDGSVKELNAKNSTGKITCHLATSGNGNSLIAASWGTGNVSVISIGKDGKFSTEARDHNHEIYRAKNQNSRSHHVNLTPDKKYAVITDLGLDIVFIYKLDANQEKMKLSGYYKLHSGAGPRHSVFHPNGKFFYVINELDSTMTTFHYLGEGKFEKKGTLSTKPKSWKAYNNCADIHVHPNGKFLYGSNRGNNSIVIFKIDQTDGSLTVVGHESTRGNWPRNFTLSPSGKFLLVANIRSGDIQVFKVDASTGKLTYTGNSIKIHRPSCLKFF